MCACSCEQFASARAWIDEAATVDSMNGADRGFAVVQIDSFQRDERQRVSVREIVWTEQEAEQEVRRLNAVNADKDWWYFWQPTIVRRRS
jgi:hypothetical protein